MCNGKELYIFWINKHAEFVKKKKKKKNGQDFGPH